MGKKKDKIINDKSIEFITEYLNNPAPVGYEASSQKIWMDYLKPYVDRFETDIYGSAYGVIFGAGSGLMRKKVVIEAHADEIAWSVNYISDDGLIYVIRNGGSDHQIAPSKRVKIHTKNGLVDGVFGWPAIHVRKGKDTEIKVDTNFIDVGCTTKDEVEALGVHIGCVITYPDEFMILNKDKFVCRAIDNRMGGVMIAEVARMLSENGKKLPFDLYIVNSVQEEIGLRGAEMVTNRIKPDIAIITDVCHDTTTPMINQKVEGTTKMGSGPVITYAPAVQNNLREMIIGVAEDNDIPFQRMASSSQTGTDTDAFAYSNGGVASALISLPLRYMHTTVEMVHRDDVENVIKLIYESLLSINEETNFSYF
jgi:putative aminopeptidase FrvX